MVEKPAVADAPSDLIIIGRYVLTPDVFAELEHVQPGSGGEIQLTDALRAQAAKGPFHGVLSNIARYDTGTPLGSSGVPSGPTATAAAAGPAAADDRDGNPGSSGGRPAICPTCSLSPPNRLRW